MTARWLPIGAVAVSECRSTIWQPASSHVTSPAHVTLNTNLNDVYREIQNPLIQDADCSFIYDLNPSNTRLRFAVYAVV